MTSLLRTYICFSTIALNKILDEFNLEIFDVENISTHGGSNRYYIKNRNNSFYKIKKNLQIQLKKEISFGLNRFSTYKKFAQKVIISRKKLQKIFKKLEHKKLSDMAQLQNHVRF